MDGAGNLVHSTVEKSRWINIVDRQWATNMTPSSVPTVGANHYVISSHQSFCEEVAGFRDAVASSGYSTIEYYAEYSSLNELGVGAWMGVVGFYFQNGKLTFTHSAGQCGNWQAVAANTRVSASVVHPASCELSGVTTYLNGALSAGTKTTTWQSTYTPSDVIKVGNSQSSKHTAVGNVYAMRVYSRALTADEIARNRQIDMARFSATPERYRWNDTTKEIETLVSVRATGATVSIDGGDATESVEKWVVLGESVVMQVMCPSGQSVQKWFGGSPVAGGTAGSYTLAVDKTYDLVAYVGTGLKSWTGTGGDNFWTTDTNWSPEGAPVAGEIVTLGSGSVVLTNSTPELGAVEIVGTLAMSNWTTRLNAKEVVISSGGVVKPSNFFQTTDMSNRVWIACKNLTVAIGGKINADSLGYGWRTASTSWASAGMGPGAGASDGGGGGHGGRGGRGYAYAFGKVYDSIEAPTMPGSSGGASANGRGTKGGGAVRIEATGEVILQGSVTADGGQSSSTQCANGSGGSVYISCRTFRGDGLVTALGGNPTGSNGGGGGGGRIAITYDTTAQAAVSPKPTPKIKAGCCRQGFAYVIPQTNPNRKSTQTNWAYMGDPGTVYLSDASFYPGTCWKDCSGYFHVPGLDGSTLELDAIDFANETADTSKGGRHPVLRNLNIVVNGPVSLGNLTQLSLSNCTFKAQSVALASGAYLEVRDRSTVEVEGDFTLNGSSAATFWAGQTNGVAAATWNQWGQAVKIGGCLRLNDTSKVFPWSHQTKGGSPHFQLGSLFVAANAVIEGSGRGWGYVDGTQTGVYGKGPGSPQNQNGASYGGRGGGGSSAYGRIYGSEKNPTDPGSDAGNSSNSTYVGGWGGGLFWAEVFGRVWIDGIIRMDGTGTLGNEAGGGSGGGVNIVCGQLAGIGSITANGGGGGSSTSWSGNGGGGRIALAYRSKQHWTGTITASAGSNAYTYSYAATDGTIYQKTVGGMMVILR